MDRFDSSVADLGFRSKTSDDAGIQSLTCISSRTRSLSIYNYGNVYKPMYN